MKVTATTPLRRGTKDGVEDIAEGASFDCDKKEADELIAAGLVVKGHAKSEGTQKPPTVTREDLDAALGALPGDNMDPEYVVKAMRVHFGELFTAADEAKVRELVGAQG